MQIFYFDEIKCSPPRQRAYWMGGIGIPVEKIPELEQKLGVLAHEIFGTSELKKEYEFHGVNIFQGSGNFKGVEIEKRLYTLKKILTIIHSNDFIKKVYVRIFPDNLSITSQKPEQIAFMFFVERANEFLSELGKIGILIGDYDQPAVSRSIYELSQYRESGTLWRNIEIGNIVDTVHFAQSHHSRMIQLADIYLYGMLLHYQPHEQKYPRRKMKEFFAELEGFNVNTKSTAWPAWPMF